MIVKTEIMSDDVVLLSFISENRFPLYAEPYLTEGGKAEVAIRGEDDRD